MNMCRYRPHLFELLGLGEEFLVESALEVLVVGDGLLQLRAQAVRVLGFFLKTCVDVVEINLKVGQLNGQLVALLCTDNTVTWLLRHRSYVNVNVNRGFI